MSPTLFSGKEDSAPYSTVNVLMVGLRGMVFPLLGAWIGQVWGIEPVLVISSLMSFAAAFFMHTCAQSVEKSKKTSDL
jgi:hypothetical protein